MKNTEIIKTFPLGETCVNTTQRICQCGGYHIKSNPDGSYVAGKHEYEKCDFMIPAPPYMCWFIKKTSNNPIKRGKYNLDTDDGVFVTNVTLMRVLKAHNAPQEILDYINPKLVYTPFCSKACGKKLLDFLKQIGKGYSLSCDYYLHSKYTNFKIKGNK